MSQAAHVTGGQAGKCKWLTGRFRGQEKHSSSANRHRQEVPSAASSLARKKRWCKSGGLSSSIARATFPKVDALSKRQVNKLWSKALAHVTQEFSPKEHLLDKVYKFLEPVVNTTCQGYHTTAVMVAGSMATLTNGAAVKIWN